MRLVAGAERPADAKPTNVAARAAQGTILLVEDDPVLGQMVADVLGDEGYAVSLLGVWDADVLRAAVGRLEPDCVLLDGTEKSGYGRSWLDAAWARDRSRRVPVVMFTASASASDEARAEETGRSRAAGFFAVLSKPFDLDQLLDVVERATGSVPRFDRSDAAEAGRTAELVRRLQEAGARDVHASTRREWANFYAGDTGDVLRVLYWSQRDGVYYVARQDPAAGSMRQIGRFFDLDVATMMAVMGDAGSVRTGSEGADEPTS